MLKNGIAIFVVALGMGVGRLTSRAVDSFPESPNIILILTDDQAVDTMAALGETIPGGKTIQTPNLDRLVNSGTVFTQACNMGAWNGAVCLASRSMLNTGRFVWHSHEAGIRKYKQEVAEGKLWSQRMRAAGYETYMTGKWHVDVPPTEVFDHIGTIRGGMPGTVKFAYMRPREDVEDRWIPWDTNNGGYWQGGKHWSEVVADEAEEFIRNASSSSRPFFMYLAFNAPHDPRQAPEVYGNLYPPEEMALPENFLPEHPLHQAMGLGPRSAKGLRDETLAPFPRTEHAIQVHRREYYALVTHLDEQIGRIMDALKASGKADNTVVFFTSDHGLAVGRHGLMGKQNLYEHSVRVPFVMVGPGIPAGKKISTRIYLQDAMATSLDLAKADRAGVEFRSLLPLLRGERHVQYEAVYGAYEKNFQRSGMDGRYKLILYPKAPAVELFDLRTDPLEKKNLADDPETLPLQRKLFRSLLTLQKETGDPLELKPVFPNLATSEE